MNIKKIIFTFAELTKVRVTFFVTLTTLFGYICVRGDISLTALAATFGIFFLACSSAVINHLQEQVTDAMMERTKNRPLPSGRVTRNVAIDVAFILFLSGILTLILFTDVVTLALGVSAVIWYNGIYTPLKKKNFIAIIPGSVIGAIPPVAGWVAAGGSLSDPRIQLIAFFFFIWQIPHFWLLLLLHRSDYESAGFPTIFKYFNQAQLARLTFAGTMVTGLIAILFPLFSVLNSSFAGYCILGAFVLLLIKSTVLLKTELTRQSFRYVFLGINLFVLFVVVVVSIDKLFIVLH